MIKPNKLLWAVSNMDDTLAVYSLNLFAMLYSTANLITIDKHDLKMDYPMPTNATSCIIFPNGAKFTMDLWHDALRLLKGFGWDLDNPDVEVLSLGKGNPAIISFKTPQCKAYITLSPSLKS